MDNIAKNCLEAFKAFHAMVKSLQNEHNDILCNEDFVDLLDENLR